MDWAAARVGVERALKKRLFAAADITDAQWSMLRAIRRLHQAELTTNPVLRFDGAWVNPEVLKTRDMSIVEYKRKD